MLTLLLLINMLTWAFNVAPATASLPVHNTNTGEYFATIVSAQDKYLIVAADNFYNNPKLREFTNWRLNEFDVEMVNVSTILDEFPIPPEIESLKIRDLESMSTTIEPIWGSMIFVGAVDANGNYYSYGYYKFTTSWTYIDKETTSYLETIFIVLTNFPLVQQGDSITLIYDWGNSITIFLPEIIDCEYTCYTKLYVAINGTAYFKKTEAHSVQNFINSTYQDNPNLKYVLLVGDVDKVPSFGYYYQFRDSVTDHLFVCLEGNDYAPELAIGRLPANNVIELEVMINKTMNYRPIALNKFLLMEGFDAGEVGDLEYETTRSVIISSLQSWLENPKITELRKKNGDLTKSNIINAINSGQDFIIYCGHSSRTCWYGLCTSDMASLDNETPSIAFAFSCLSGDYGYASDCMGEAFLKDEDSGVTGYFGSSSPTYSGAANRLAEELFRAIPYSNTIGEAILKSKVKYSKTYPLFHLSIYNLLGDPALNLRIPTPGDVNGDCKVDASDLFDLSNAYGSKLGDPNWNPNCDFNGDDKVDASDLFDLSKNYGKTG